MARESSARATRQVVAAAAQQRAGSGDASGAALTCRFLATGGIAVSLDADGRTPKGTIPGRSHEPVERALVPMDRLTGVNSRGQRGTPTALVFLRARIAMLAASALACGCAHLLPDGSTDASMSFTSFEAAQNAFERIVPYRTAVKDLKSVGFDLAANRNVRLIPYPDLVARLAPNASIPLSEHDVGIRECILARSACQVYEFHLAHETRSRRGGFVQDFLNFKRTTAVIGWRFDALVAVRDDVILFRAFGGEPHNERIEHESNPLGPLQSGGESLAGRALR